MMILPTTSVERLAVRPVATATQRTLPVHARNTGIVPPWLSGTKTTPAVAGLVALENTGIVPPWLLSDAATAPAITPSTKR